MKIVTSCITFCNPFCAILCNVKASIPHRCYSKSNNLLCFGYKKDLFKVSVKHRLPGHKTLTMSPVIYVTAKQTALYHNQDILYNTRPSYSFGGGALVKGTNNNKICITIILSRIKCESFLANISEANLILKIQLNTRVVPDNSN